jgi:hypothetical protein
MFVIELLKFYDKPIPELPLTYPYPLLEEKGMVDELNEPDMVYDSKPRRFETIVVIEDKERMKKMIELRCKEIKRKVLFFYCLLEEFKLSIIYIENLKKKGEIEKSKLVEEQKNKIYDLLQNYMNHSDYMNHLTSNYSLFKNNMIPLHG